MIIPQLSNMQNENETDEYKSDNKKMLARTIYAIVGGIIILNLAWWIVSLCTHKKNTDTQK